MYVIQKNSSKNIRLLYTWICFGSNVFYFFAASYNSGYRRYYAYNFMLLRIFLLKKTKRPQRHIRTYLFFWRRKGYDLYENSYCKSTQIYAADFKKYFSHHVKFIQKTRQGLFFAAFFCIILYYFYRLNILLNIS